MQSRQMSPLSPTDLSSFKKEGFVVIAGFLDTEEVDLLTHAVRSDQLMKDHAMNVCDTSGRKTNMSLWNTPGDDIYGAIARSSRVVDAMEQFLGDEVYHYHSKLSAKEPKVGGAWEWHQDYGYWYKNGCLYPDMASVIIAIDENTQANGCLQVVRGSHHVGRIEHGRFGDQTGADPERVAHIQRLLETVHCEMKPGDALFFHCNMLHCSGPNLSEYPRWNLICCYNTRHNDPVEDSHHPRYTPLEKLPDSAIKEIGARTSSATQQFLKQEEDKTVG